MSPDEHLEMAYEDRYAIDEDLSEDFDEDDDDYDADDNMAGEESLPYDGELSYTPYDD